MISVEEGERLLLKHQEDSIEQLEVFRQVVELDMNELASVTFVKRGNTK